MFAFLPVGRFLAGVLSLRYYGILGNDARHKRSIKIVSRLASPLGPPPRSRPASDRHRQRHPHRPEHPTPGTL